MNTESNNKPFSLEYVLATTVKHMFKSVDISIQKTFERISEFDGNQEKSQEIFKTLAMLHALRKRLEDFKYSNQES